MVIGVIVVVAIQRQHSRRFGPEQRAVFRRQRQSSGVPSQQTWPFRHTTLSEARITTFRSWLTMRMPQPVVRRTLRSGDRRQRRPADPAPGSVRRESAVRFSQKRACQKHALELPTRKIRHLAAEKIGEAQPAVARRAPRHPRRVAARTGTGAR